MLDGRGADLFMLETFYDLDELVDAITAVRGVSALPIVALLTFDEDAETLAGVERRRGRRPTLARSTSPRSAQTTARGLLAALTALEQMSGKGRVLAALPNIGLASLSGGRVIYPHATPDYFAEFAAHARDLGARVIGGCCGTTPAEIAAIRAAIEEERRAAVAPRARRARARRSHSARSSARPASRARSARASSWSRCSSTHRSAARTPVCSRWRRTLEESGRVRFVDINDNATARAGMSSLMVSARSSARPGSRRSRT